MATEQLAVRLLMKSDQYVRESRKAASATSQISKTAGTAAGKTQSLGKQYLKTGSLIRGSAVAGGFFLLGNAIGSAVDQAEAMSSQYAITEQVIKKTGGAANLTAEEIKTLSKRQAALTGISKETVTQGNNVLLTFKNIKNETGEGNDVFERTSDLMLDISATMGTDAKSAALQLGKALNDPVANMGALSRAGLTFSEQQKDQIKDLVANNDLLSAQKIILGELESQLGGTADASADASDKIGLVTDELFEAAGTALLPVLENISIELSTIVGLTDELDRVAQYAGGAADSAEAFLTVVTEETGGAGFISGLGGAMREFSLFLVPGISRTERFRDTLEELADRLSLEEVQRARDGIDVLGESMGLTASEIEIVADVLDNELNRVAVESADKVLLGKLAPAIEEVGDETAITTGNLSDLSDQINSLIDPAFAALDALDRVETAQAELNSIVAEYGPKSDQARDAGQHLIEAYGDLVAAADAYSQESGKDLIESILEIGTNAGVPLQTLQSIIDRLGEIDGFEANPTVNVRGNFNLASSALAHIGGPFHSGGVVPGPRGSDQLIVAAGGETVLPTHQSGFQMGETQLHFYIDTMIGTSDSAIEVISQGLEKARRRGVS